MARTNPVAAPLAAGHRAGAEQALRDLVREFQGKGEWVKVMALELLYVKGWGNAEVAAKLNRSEQDIANLKFQAKKRLHDHLAAAKLSAAVFPELSSE